MYKEIHRAKGSRLVEMIIGMSGKHVLLPFYHCVAPAQPDHIDPSMYMVRSPELFEDDIKYFAENYRLISISELHAIIASGKAPSQPVCHISFDDGLREFYDYALPILEKNNAPASVFINRDFVDNRAMFYRYKVALLMKDPRLNDADKKKLLQATHSDLALIKAYASRFEIDFDAYTEDVRPYMSKIQLKSLAKRDIAIGAHGTDHTWFKYLEIDEMREQVLQSFLFLRNELQLSEMFFSFPFSDEGVPSDFFDWLFDEAGCLLSFGISGMKEDVRPEHLHRIPMENDLSPAREIIRRERVKRLLRAPLGRNKIRR